MRKTMLLLIILASLIPGILAVVQYFDNEKKEKQNSKNELLLNTKIDSLKIDNSELKKELAILSTDNAKLSHQLTETALKLNENVIGQGDIDIEVHNTKPTEFNFRFVNNSDLPVHNANITVQNYSEIIKCEIIKETESQIHIRLDCYKNHFIKYAGLDLNPHSASIGNDNNYPFTNEYMNFAIQIETRKKTVIYHLVYKIIDGNLQRSFRIYNLEKNKKVFISESNPLKLKAEYWKEHFYEKILYTN